MIVNSAGEVDLHLTEAIELKLRMELENREGASDAPLVLPTKTTFLVLPYRFHMGRLHFGQSLASFDLLKAYEFGSATALHVRLTSLVRGAPIVTKSIPRSPRFSVPYQEIDKENPFRFLLSVLNYIRNQERVMIALGKASPDADTLPPTVIGRAVVDFERSLAALARSEVIFKTIRSHGSFSANLG
jgi:hypothetical protein